MTDVRPLPYVGTPTEQAKRALREGKNLLGVDFYVKPVLAQPGVVGHVLAFEWPEFYIDAGFALLTPPYTPDRMAGALKEVLGITDGRYLTKPERWLEKYLGPGVKFIEEVELG